MDKKSALQYGYEYSNKVKSKFPSVRVFMYGSYAYGNPNNDSDIDIAVISNHFTDNWLDISSELWEMTENVNTIIEPILLDSSNDRNGFTHHVMHTGIEL